VVVADEHLAIKRLKSGVSREGVVRFKREASLLMTLRDSAALRVVSAREIRDVGERVEIVMDRLSGNLDSVLARFKGQPFKAARALVPIAETLAELARRPQAIYHRDIKPANLLYRTSEEDLFLADFGCAFIAGDERLTPDRRALGAWAYRPPEYSNGRVAEVDEKGDVFSLGKVFWAMIYGEKGIVFPGPVWFTQEFDLSFIFPDEPGIHHAMVAISKACAIDPHQRPRHAEFADSLRQLANGSADLSFGSSSIDLLRAAAVVEVEHAQRRAATAAFVRAIHDDLHNAIRLLHASSPEFQMWGEWMKDALRTHQTADALIRQVAEQMSDAPVVNSRFRGRHLVTRFYPASLDSPAKFSATVGVDSLSSLIMRVENQPGGMRYEVVNISSLPASGPYSSEVLLRFLETASLQVFGVK